MKVPESIQIQQKQNWELVEIKKREARMAALEAEKIEAQAKEFDENVKRAAQPKIAIPNPGTPGQIQN